MPYRLPNYPPSTGLLDYCPREYKQHVQTIIAEFIDTDMVLKFHVGSPQWFAWGRITYRSGEVSYELFVNPETYLHVPEEVFDAYIKSKGG